jgi:hypothetical protein
LAISGTAAIPAAASTVTPAIVTPLHATACIGVRTDHRNGHQNDRIIDSLKLRPKSAAAHLSLRIRGR